MKRFLRILGSFSLVFALASCSAFISESDFTGLTVSLPQARSAAWYENTESFVVAIDSGSYSEEKMARAGESVEFRNVPAGDYKVTALAKDELNIIIGKGSASAEVQSGSSSTVSLTINRFDSFAGSTVSLHDGASNSFAEYSSLSEALLNASSTTTGTTHHTITFNGDIKDNLISEDSNVPSSINRNILIDLNGHSLRWDSGSETSDSNSERALFQVGSGVTLAIKNGTISSEKTVSHLRELFKTSGGTIVLSNVSILNIETSKNLIKIETSSGGPTGNLYTKNVVIKNCKSTDTTDGAIYVSQSKFYAANTKIENVLDKTSTLYLSSVTGAYVGGSITLSSSTTLSTEETLSQRDNAIFISNSSTTFFVSSSEIYSNTKVHGSPVYIISGGSLNLSDGFKYENFDLSSFNTVTSGDDYIYANSSLVGLSRGANVISASDSSDYALNIGTGCSVYMGGNSQINGLVKMNITSSSASAIALTGEITSNKPIYLDFGEDDIYKYATISGNFPLYWAAGSAKYNDSDLSNYNNACKIPEIFKVHVPEDYDENDYYTIQETTRTVVDAGEATGNKIYAPKYN